MASTDTLLPVPWNAQFPRAHGWFGSTARAAPAESICATPHMVYLLRSDDSDGRSMAAGSKNAVRNLSGPGITVVIPSFNHGRFIDAAIGSVLDQGYPNVEIMVVDGGSTDDTVARLRQYGDRITWSSEKDEGQAHAIEKGFAGSTKEWLTWLNSDDIQCNNAMSAVAEALERRPETDVVIGQAHYIDEAGRYLRRYPTIEVDGRTDVRRAMFRTGYLAQPSVFFRGDAYHRIGGIDRSLRYVMDYELWIRFALSGAIFTMVHRDISGNRWHGGAKTVSNLSDLYAEAIAVQRRHYGRVSPYFVQALSDHRFQTRSGSQHAPSRQLVQRWLRFKAAWIRLNLRRPLYCFSGLFTETLAKSGPLVGDRLTAAELFRVLGEALLPRGKTEQ